ncbi:MAG: primosomal replication protein N [Burkholderiaceae bacterium]
MNQLQFVASIAERELMRYTPAGIPIVSAKLQHVSKQTEARVERQVEFEISAIAAGEISGRFDQARLGAMFHFTGFLARKNRNSKTLVFHIIDFEPTSTTGASNGIR